MSERRCTTDAAAHGTAARCSFCPLGLLGLLALASASAGAAPPPRPVPLTSDTWHPPEPASDLHWQLLELPERVVQLGLAPLQPLLTVAERYRLDRRLFDLVSNDDRTAFVFPYVIFGTSDGLGGGVMLMHNDLWGDNEKGRLSGVVHTNLDWQAKASYRQTVAWLDGRLLGASLHAEFDEDIRYFGIGGDTPESNKRALSREQVTLELQGQLASPQLLNLRADSSLAYVYQRLGSGQRADARGLAPDDEAVAAPPGFDQDLHLAQGKLWVTVDTRDRLGRTRRGLVSRLELSAMRDLNGAGLSAFGAGFSALAFFEILPRNRVLVLGGGIAAAAPWSSSHRLPLAGHVSLGRKTHLRGYTEDRFLDRMGWWSSLEYRWPVFEHEFEEIGLSAVLFGDLGRAGDSMAQLFAEVPRWSVGFGFQADTAIFSIFRLLVGVSPEGAEVVLGAGDFM